MSDYPVQWTGWRAVVTLPGHIDEFSVGQIREELLLVINRGARELIADMTGTVSWDHAGVNAVVRAWQRAAADGTQLRLAVAAEVIRRVLTLSGLDRLIPVYPSLAAAIAAAAPTAAVPVTSRPGGPHQARPPKAGGVIATGAGHAVP